MTAAAQPWTTRAATSTGSTGASPHQADAAANTTSPQPKTRRAPSQSDTVPAEISSAANGTVYPSTTHCRPDVAPCSDRPIGVSATFTAVASRLIMKNPSNAAVSASLPRNGG